MEQTTEFFSHWRANPPGPPPGMVTATTVSTPTLPNVSSNHNVKSQLTMAHYLAPQTQQSSHIPPSARKECKENGSKRRHKEEGRRSPFTASSSTPPSGRPSSTSPSIFDPTPHPQPTSAASSSSTSSSSVVKPHIIVDEDLIVPASASSSHEPTMSPPTHLSLLCRQCSHPMATLPIVQSTHPSSSSALKGYHQNISMSYFYHTVKSALKRLNHDDPAPSSPSSSDPSSLSIPSLVCSAFSLGPPLSGIFGWRGYPCVVPDGLPSQSFLSQQFYNIWSEQDQICYQPLCCAVRKQKRICAIREVDSINFVRIF